jgi:hypothetical protein
MNRMFHFALCLCGSAVFIVDVGRRVFERWEEDLGIEEFCGVVELIWCGLGGRASVGIGVEAWSWS